jgi:hypothetical protein
VTDRELAEYLGISDLPRWPWYIANLDPKRRATYERMREVEEDIKLWQAGVGPKPTGVILCHEHKRGKRHG